MEWEVFVLVRFWDFYISTFVNLCAIKQALKWKIKLNGKELQQNDHTLSAPYLNIHVCTLVGKLCKERMAKFPFRLSDFINKTPIFIKLQPPLKQSTVQDSSLYSSIIYCRTVTSTRTCFYIRGTVKASTPFYSSRFSSALAAVINHKKVINYDDESRNGRKGKRLFCTGKTNYIKSPYKRLRKKWKTKWI